MDAKDLKALRVRLKTGEYDGTDIMQAWIAIDELVDLLKKKEGMVLVPEWIVSELIGAYNGGDVLHASLYEAIVKLDQSTRAKEQK